MSQTVGSSSLNKAAPIGKICVESNDVIIAGHTDDEIFFAFYRRLLSLCAQTMGGTHFSCVQNISPKIDLIIFCECGIYLFFL